MSARRRLPPAPLAAGLLALFVLGLLGSLSMRVGSAGSFPLADSAHGLLVALGLAEGSAPAQQAILELRLWRALVAAGVGGALALSGALLQGLFRNGLASPSVLGVTAGASLGASIAIVLAGGYGPSLFVQGSAGWITLLVPAGGFLGALAAAALVVSLASSGGKLSVPTLLLVGIAINTCIAGALAALQYWALADFEIHRAILAWTFGTLDDRSSTHAWVVWLGLAVAATCLPFVSLELDLFAGGEADAGALGVNTVLVKGLTLVSAALAAAFAVAVAGQISFVGLVVPHLLRALIGPSHRALLPLSILGGATFLLGADLAQRALFPDGSLQPGVVMSLLGGPFFLYLLWRDKRAVESW